MSNGCSILYFIVQYREHSAKQWQLVSGEIPAETGVLVSKIVVEFVVLIIQLTSIKLKSLYYLVMYVYCPVGARCQLILHSI